MLSNFFKTAIRSLGKNKVFSAINLAGLATGLAVFILIMLWAHYEMSMNGFHADKDRIATVMVNKKTANDIASFPAVPSSLSAALKKDIPAIQYSSRASWGDTRLFTRGEKHYTEYGLYVEPDFLKIFSFPLVKGNIETALTEPTDILITEKLAKKYFGNENPIGQTISVERTLQYKVKGILKDMPDNASFSFEYLIPFSNYLQYNMGGKESWSINNIRTYVKLNAGTDRTKLNATLKNFLQKHTDQQANITLFLWDLNDWYLRFDFKNGVYAGGGRIVYVKMFIIIAIFILLLACINFMNLSTARSTQRAKEVAVRKVIGAGRKSLVAQFIGESVFLSFIAGFLALVLAELALPAFNSLFRKHISIDYSNISSILIYLAIILVTGLLAGSYPSLVLSSFKPVKTLKSMADQAVGSVLWIRKGLVVSQFAISIILIVGTIVVYNQVNFIKNKNLGYKKENLLWFPNSIPVDKNEFAVQEFSKVPGVINVGRASMTFTSPNNRGSDVKWAGKKEGDDIFFSFLTGDNNIIQTMGIEIKEGRAFSKNFTTDTGAFILNEEAVKRMGLTKPVGLVIEAYGGKGTVVGVAKDFHIESMHNPIAPMIIECRPDWTWLYYIRIDGRNTQQTIAKIEQVYNRMAPGYVFDYTFQDSEYERTYRSETQIGTLVNCFAFLAIFISALGLLGLTMFTVQRKTREIGIRRVLGASVPHIVSLVSKQFIWLILIATIIAVIPAWYFMNDWLQNYTYRVNIGWQVFAFAGTITLAIAVVTIGALAVKAAFANPVESLRTE